MTIPSHEESTGCVQVTGSSTWETMAPLSPCVVPELNAKDRSTFLDGFNHQTSSTAVTAGGAYTPTAAQWEVRKSLHAELARRPHTQSLASES
jgi:hypothetical protein